MTLELGRVFGQSATDHQIEEDISPHYELFADGLGILEPQEFHHPDRIMVRDKLYTILHTATDKVESAVISIGNKTGNFIDKHPLVTAAIATTVFVATEFAHEKLIQSELSTESPVSV
ncbi:MAG TPA: hypothetical protein PLD54_02665 [Candidatus Levybacteria bacterium]|nr:hypothetical protein [Candidatus Levybacteria bacterium]